MRLIDADKLVVFLKRLGRFLKVEENHKQKCRLIGDIINYVEKKAATDPADLVPKGRWVKKTESKQDTHTGEYWEEEYCSCPLCGKDSDWEHNFCPNCGADMRADDIRPYGETGGAEERAVKRLSLHARNRQAVRQGRGQVPEQDTGQYGRPEEDGRMVTQ